MLAAVKVVGALGIWEDLGFETGENIWGMDPKLLTVIGISILVLIDAGLSGLWGVVVTDFFQLYLARFGALVVAIFAGYRQAVGGLSGLVEQSQGLAGS